MDKKSKKKKKKSKKVKKPKKVTKKRSPKKKTKKNPIKTEKRSEDEEDVFVTLDEINGGQNANDLTWNEVIADADAFIAGKPEPKMAKKVDDLLTKARKDSDNDCFNSSLDSACEKAANEAVQETETAASAKVAAETPSGDTLLASPNETFTSIQD